MNTLDSAVRARLIALRRYRVHVERKGHDPLGEVLYVACPPDPNGGWVRWADVAMLLTALPPPPQVAPDLSLVTRVEVINETGRVYSHRPCTVQLSYQDAGRTLKVLVNWPPIDAQEQETKTDHARVVGPSWVGGSDLPQRASEPDSTPVENALW